MRCDTLLGGLAWGGGGAGGGGAYHGGPATRHHVCETFYVVSFFSKHIRAQDGWMHGWMDGWTYAKTCKKKLPCHGVLYS